MEALSHTLAFYVDGDQPGQPGGIMPELQNKKEQALIDEKIAELAARHKEDLVRGALLRCSHGSHQRMLNLNRDHGVYVRQNPQARATDAAPGRGGDPLYNIGWFGHCSSPTPPPSGAVRLRVFSPVDERGAYRQAPVDATAEGPQCEPWFSTGCWQNTDGRAAVPQDPAGAGSRSYDVATTQSYILCRHGGIVYPLTSGQTGHAVFTPAFIECPFPADRAEGSKFMKWCDENGACPYWPGSDDYDGWHADKIGALMAEESDMLQKLMASGLFGERDGVDPAGIALGMRMRGRALDLGTPWQPKLGHIQTGGGSKADKLYSDWVTGNVQFLGAEGAAQRMKRHGSVRDAYYAGRSGAPSVAEDILAAEAQFGTLGKPVYPEQGKP
jgi:hypothetical protein